MKNCPSSFTRWLLACGLFAVLAPSVAAQTVVDACYVEKSGVVYLIDPTGEKPGNLPTECAKPGKHFQLSWMDAEGADHGALAGLTDDDHPQYLVITGSRALTGDLDAGGNKVGGLAAATEAGDAVRFDEAVVDGDAAAGDLSGSFPNPTVVALQGNAVDAVAPEDGQVLAWDEDSSTWKPMATQMVVTDHSALMGLGDDDHSQYLLADGVRNALDGFAVTGTFHSGAIPISGAGTRLMWHPAKAAFRAGTAIGSEWNDASIGRASVAMGELTTASASWTVALGGGATASGESAVALGEGEARGKSSFAVNGTATAEGAIALGGAATSSGIDAMAQGQNAVASGRASHALGDGTEATGAYSTAIGVGALAVGEYSLALGRDTQTNGDNSTVIGVNAEANHLGSFAYSDVSAPADHLATTGPNQFLVRAAGGFGINLDDPVPGGLSVGGTIESRSGGVRFPDGSVQTRAAVSAGPGSVGTLELADGSVGSVDLADGSVQGVDIADGSIQTADLGDGIVTAAKLAPGITLGGGPKVYFIRQIKWGARSQSPDLPAGVRIDDTAVTLVTPELMMCAYSGSYSSEVGELTSLQIADFPVSGFLYLRFRTSSERALSLSPGTAAWSLIMVCPE